jgi:tetratricopeptide (TPR) repeat protein
MHQTLYQDGIAKMATKDYAAAIAAFDQAIQQCSEFAEAYYHRGRAQFELKQFSAAIADYTFALKLNSTYDSVYFARGLAHLAIAQFDAVVADAKQAILLKPNHAAAYDLLGTARQQQGAMSKAIASYKKAVELYLDQRDIANCRRCLALIRKLQASKTFSTPAPDLPNPNPTPIIDATKFLQQAVIKAQKGNIRGAMEDLDWAVQIDPQDAHAYARRAQVRTRLGDWQGAMDDYRQAARLFLDRADKSMAEEILQQIQQLKSAQPPKATRSYTRSSSVAMAQPPVGKPSRAIQAKLLRLVGDDRKIAVGLVQRLKLRQPGMPEDWYWEKAIYDLERDRQ